MHRKPQGCERTQRKTMRCITSQRKRSNERKIRRKRRRTTTSIIILPFAPANPLPPSVKTSWAITVERKNIDTPIPPRSANTPVAGKMIMPSIRNYSLKWTMERMKGRNVQETPSSMFNRHPSNTAGMARNAVFRWYGDLKTTSS